jgi:hypothetical protein
MTIGETNDKIEELVRKINRTEQGNRGYTQRAKVMEGSQMNKEFL